MFLFFCGIICLILSSILMLFSIKKHKINIEIDKQNQEIKKKNISLKEELLELGEKKVAALEDLEKINKILEKQTQESQKSFENYCEILEISYEAKENEYNAMSRALVEKMSAWVKMQQAESRKAFEYYIGTLEKEYSNAELNFDKEICEIVNKIKEHKDELEKIRLTYSATKEAQRREEEMSLQSDFYSLHLTPIEQDTITLIEDLKPRIPEPRVLSMLIWTTYFQKQMTTLCNNVLGPNIVCGIYKITNKKSGLCYIGQATDVANRWKQHAKCGLGIDTPAQNKLYRAMQKEGLINFTFELLEMCPRSQLNEKEKYYIELYQAYDFGYNSTGGNK